MIIAVFDANIFISALISEKGASARLLNMMKDGLFSVAMSSVIFAEISAVVRYPRITQKYHLTNQKITEFLDLLRDQVIFVEPQQEVAVVRDDPEDDKYIACALAAGAQFIISGDGHLQEVKRYQGVEIMAPAPFLAYLSARNHVSPSP